MKSKKYVSKSEKDTEKLAEEFAGHLTGGEVIFLVGDLGAGKTTFVKAVARALGIQSRILSPTFSLIRSHSVSSHKKIRQLHHVDLYRMDDKDEAVEEILKEFQKEKDGVIFIEWPKENISQRVDWKVVMENKNGQREIQIARTQGKK